MSIVYEELTWQSQRVVNSNIESTHELYGKRNFEEINNNDNDNFIIKETHPIRKGLSLVREFTYVTEPMHYLPFEANYIGVCFVFADKKTDRNKLAFKDIYHDKLNVTNGFAYNSETLLALNKPLHYVGLQFDPAFIMELNEQQHLPKWLIQLTTQKNGQVLDTVTVPPMLRQLAWQLCQLPVTSQFTDVLRIESKALDWLASLLDLNTTFNATNQPNTFDKAFDRVNIETRCVLKACDIIHIEYAQPLTIKELATRVGTNTSYLKNNFKQHTGMSIHDYLTQYRLTQANKLLLQHPKLEIRIIAELCGYQAGRFSQLFKQTYGMTPSAYRNCTHL